jgi:hypothetical protein
VQAAKEKCADLRRSSDSTNVPFDDAGRAALAACLKENGATLRSDKFPLMGLNRRDPKTEAALEACRTLLPGRAPRPSPS